VSSGSEFSLSADCAFEEYLRAPTVAVVSAVLSGYSESGRTRNQCAEDSARYSTMESTTVIQQEIRESDDGASGGVALRFAAIFDAVRL